MTATPGAWEPLFDKAMRIIDATPGLATDNWSFGGGTVLMLKYQHRISQDIDIFVDDPQWLGFFNPDLSDIADTLASGGAIVDRRFVKLYCDEGEIDFVAAGPVAPEPARVEVILGRRLRVETCAEIVGKKLFYRARDFTARDIFDLSLALHVAAAEMAPLLPRIAPKAGEVLRRIERARRPLQEDFAALRTIAWNPSFADATTACIAWLRSAAGNYDPR